MFMILMGSIFVFFFKQKTAYEMRISDWSSDVCSSDLAAQQARQIAAQERDAARTSRLFLAGSGQSPGSANAGVTGGEPAAGMVPVAAAPAEPAARVSPKQAFLRSAGDRRTLASDRLATPPDPHILQPGSLIPAAFIPAIHSDLTGQNTTKDKPKVLVPP